MNSAAIIGYGRIGQAVDHLFSIGRWFDRNGSNITLEEAAQQRYIFICLPTPTVNGKCFTDDIIAIIKQIRDYAAGQNVFIVKSTVSPGTCKHIMEKLDISWVVYNPEFLTGDTWKEDMENPGMVVIGAENSVFSDDVAGLYQGRYPRSVDIIQTDTLTAELAKWAINAFYVTKVVFANQVFDFSQKVGANYETLKDIMYKRKWIGKNHLDPWHKGGRGAGGLCLPKDLEAMADMSQLPLLKTVKGLNDGYLSIHEKEENG